MSRLSSYFRSFRQDSHTRKILNQLSDRERDFHSLRLAYQNSSWNKYLDLDLYVPVSVGVCQSLNLIGGPSRRILDIGCGTGLFLFCAQHFGHRGVGIDIEDDLMRDMAQILNVERRIERVRPFVPLSVEGEFDLITAMGTQFDFPNAKEGRSRWGCAEWRFLLSDLERRLSPSGRVFLRINRGKEARMRGVNYYDEALFEAMRHGHRGGIAYLFERDGLSRAVDNLSRASDTASLAAAVLARGRRCNEDARNARQLRVYKGLGKG